MYEEVRRCDAIWDVTASVATNRHIDRTAATEAITRTKVRLDFAESEIINSSFKSLAFANANGGNLYLYPGFVMMRDQASDFGLIELSELTIESRLSRFIEEEQIPSDSEVTGYTWKKTNKDGSRDKRFSDNYQIPIAKYGELIFSSPTGLSEAYLFSSFSKSENFAVAFENYRKELTAFAQRSTNLQKGDDDLFELTDIAEEPVIPASVAALPTRRRNFSLDWVALVFLFMGTAVVSFVSFVSFEKIKTWPYGVTADAVHPPAATTFAVPIPAVQPNRPSTPPAPRANAQASASQAGLSRSQDRVYVQRPSVNIRSAPSTSASVVRSEVRGKQLAVFQRDGEWVQIGETVPTGWVHRSLVGPTAPPLDISPR
jgi:hypothetical protein